MTLTAASPRGFAVAVDAEAGQVTLRGPATGAAGGAFLTPVPGVELVFDRAGGWLSRLTAAAAPADEAADWIAAVFGTATAAVLRDAGRGDPGCLTLRARRGKLEVLSRLAQLQVARVTSPVPASRLWPAEAADLAGQAGLPADSFLSPALAPGVAPVRLALPASVRRQLAHDSPRPCVLRAADRQRPECFLDPGLVSPGLFRPGLWPEADLAVAASPDGAPVMTVQVALLPGTRPGALAACRARLVDAGTRQVLTSAPLRADPDSGAPDRGAPQARAQLPAPAGLRVLAESGAAWVEVVRDERQPTDGIRLRRIRRALRWADAALRAESRPDGLAPDLTGAQWLRLAALAWDRCRADWEAAGSPVRAALAATRVAAGSPRPFLAELAGDPVMLP